MTHELERERLNGCEDHSEILATVWGRTPLRRRSDLGCAGRVGVPDAHSAAHLATLARPAQHASRVQSARWPMCRVHTARPCTPPQGVDTPQLRRPLRGVCEAIVVRTHHDDRATATPSEAATGARWFPKGGLPRRLLRHGRPSWRDCSVAPGDVAFVPRSHCGRAPPAPPPLRRMEWRRWRRLRCGVVPKGGQRSPAIDRRLNAADLRRSPRSARAAIASRNALRRPHSRY